MASIDEVLKELLSLEGARSAALVDYSSGMLLASSGSGVDMELAAGGNSEVIKAKLRTMDLLNLDDSIEDILITLTGQYHLIRPLNSSGQLFIYYVLDKSRANLALARRNLKIAEQGVII